MTASAGALAPKPHPYDLKAFTELVAQANRADTSFDRDAIARGMERLVDHPNRKTSGKRLAGRLVRDAKKYLRASRRGEVLTDTFKTTDRPLAAASPEELDDVRRAVAVIHAGLLRLACRDLLVLMTQATGGTADALSVKARQYRNLVTAARARLWAEPGVAAACELVMEALGHWRFETIELLAPLTAGLYSAN